MVLPANKGNSLKVKRPEGNSPTGGKEMGLVYADIELLSVDDLALSRRGFLRREEVKRIRIKALVDSGAYELVINEDVKQQLDLPVLEERIAKLADDSERLVELVGPVEIRFENRSTVVRAMVLPGASEILLGAIPIEGLDVVIDPREQRLIVNPAYPKIPSTYAKTAVLSV
jgi:clan AA aspartic protease